MIFTHTVLTSVIVHVDLSRCQVGLDPNLGAETDELLDGNCCKYIGNILDSNYCEQKDSMTISLHPEHNTRYRVKKENNYAHASLPNAKVK